MIKSQKRAGGKQSKQKPNKKKRIESTFNYLSQNAKFIKSLNLGAKHLEITLKKMLLLITNKSI